MTKKNISEKKLRANRQNAKKSTGPKTPEGKAKSSQNALKHGLLANQILLNDDDPNEKREDFNQLLENLIDEYQPHTCMETLLVERVAVCFWRLRRAYRYEAQAITGLREGEFSPFEQMARTVTGRQPEPYARILPRESQLKLLVRYETMIERQLNRSLTQLQGGPSSPPRSTITCSPAHPEQRRGTRPTGAPGAPSFAQRRVGDETNPTPDTGLQTTDCRAAAPNEPTSTPHSEPQASARGPSNTHESLGDLGDLAVNYPARNKAIQTKKHLDELRVKVAQDPRAVMRLFGFPVPPDTEDEHEAQNEPTERSSLPICIGIKEGKNETPNVETQSKSRVHRGDQTNPKEVP